MRFRCDHCGYVGECYGIPTGDRVSAPFCRQCQKNDKLVPLGDEDGIERLTRFLYGREPARQDLLGEEEAQLFHDAADELDRLLEELAVARRG